MKKYFNNPIETTLQSLLDFLKKAPHLFAGLFIVSIIGLFIMAVAQPESSNTSTNESCTFNQKQNTLICNTNDGKTLSITPKMIGVVMGILTVLFLGLFLVGTYVTATIDYASVQAAKGHATTVRSAITGVAPLFGGYLWVTLLTVFAIFAWSLLFIIPGIYKSVRYSLAGIAYLDDPKKYRGSNALERSIDLTDQKFTTTYSTVLASSVVAALGFSQLAFASNRTSLYFAFADFAEKKQSAPQPHLISKIALYLSIALLFVGFIMAMIALT